MHTTFITSEEKSQDIPWTLLYLLRESRLLSDDQMNEVERQAGALDMPALSALLLEKGWLTAYQLQRLREGQARGLLLGQYRVLDELGEGGFGKVYKAVHGMLKRLAAVKVITPKLAQNPRIRNLFLREMSAMTRLAHPNIALAYDANQTDDVLWFAMEYVDGPNLAQYVAERGPLPIPLACAVMSQAARALQFAHENGVVHRDVKPANLLLPGAGAFSEPAAFPGESAAVLVKMVDFGLAKLFPLGAPDAASICREGECIGTPGFMSPEQARNSHGVDVRSDLYSLGCVFYFALTARPPFQGDTTVEIITEQLEKEPVPLLSLRPDVPPEVAYLVRRLMSKRPELRFPTPADFIEALNFALRTPQIPAIPAAAGRRPDQVLPASGLETAAPLPALDSTPGPAAKERLVESQIVAPAAVPTAASNDPETISGAKDSVTPLWREWRAVVDSLARGTAVGWNEGEYAALYKALMGGLRKAADSASDLHAQLHARAATLVEPWLRLRALADLDRATLIALSETCRRLDAELCPAPRVSFWTWLAFTGLLAGVALLGVAYLAHGVR